VNAQNNQNISPLVDLTGLSISTPTGNYGQPQMGNPFGVVTTPPVMPSAAPKIPSTILLSVDKGKGIQISGGFSRRQGRIYLDLVFTNQTATPLSGFAIQFNRNTFGLTPAENLNINVVNPGQTLHYPLQVATNGQVSQGPATTAVQMAVKSTEIHYFTPEIPLSVLFTESGRLEKQAYLQMWRAISDEDERTREFTGIPQCDPDSVQRKLEAYNMFFIARRKGVNDQDVLYMSVRLSNDVVLLVEFTFITGAPTIKLCTKTQNLDLAPLFEAAIEQLLRS